MLRASFRIQLSMCLTLICIFIFVNQCAGAESKQTVELPHVRIGGQQGLTPFSGSDEGTRKIIERNRIQKEAELLLRDGLYDQAIEKYREAIRPSLLNREQEKATALSAIVRIYQLQGKFDEALEQLDWFRTSAPNMTYRLKKQELEALINAKRLDSPQPIYNYVDFLEQEYDQFLPPRGHQAIYTIPIIRLYDYLGDHEQGISFIDKLLTYNKLRDSAREEYKKIKQAFLEDKLSDTTGRPTQILIHSDDLPW